MTNKREEEILSAMNEYRDVYRKLHGDDMAEKNEVWYESGWVYLYAAQRFPDGMIGKTVGPKAIQLYRLKQFKAMTETLKRRLEVMK